MADLSAELLAVALAAWVAAAIIGLCGRAAVLGRALLGLGGIAIFALIATTLPVGSPPVHVALGIGPAGSVFQLSPAALWLLGFGLASVVLASWLGTPALRQARWLAGAGRSG